MIQANKPADPKIHALAIRLARRCRRIIQSCLREDEWPVCDLAFYEAIYEAICEAPETHEDEAR